MKRLLTIITFFFCLFSFVQAQNYGTQIPLDTTFTNTDSTNLTTPAGIDSIPSTGQVTLYSPLMRIGEIEGPFDLSFKGDLTGAAGDTAQYMIYVRHLYFSDISNRDWGMWNLVSFKKDTAFSSATTYDSLNYGEQYHVSYKYDTYLKWLHQSNGLQYKIVTLDTLGSVPRLLQFGQ